MFDQPAFRALFPSLRQPDAPLYLDNGASTQTAEPVLTAMADYYHHYRANAHRASYPWARQATEQLEISRDIIRRWLRVSHREAVIFTSGTTSAINLVALGLAAQLQPGDRLLISAMEHHANLVPWQLLAQRTGAIIDIIPLDQHANLDMTAFKTLLARQPKVVACCHVSNTLGLINPVQEICEWARAAGALSVIDGAQAVAHLPVDIAAMGCDFYAFSGHKMFGPTGVGVLTGRLAALEALTPVLAGGEMIDKVSFSDVSFNALPHRLEPGTAPIAEIVGLAKAVSLLSSIDARYHEQALSERLLSGLAKLPIQILGRGERVSLVSIASRQVHHSDLAHYLAERNIAVRAGHHCTQPLHQLLGLSGSLRIALAPYNTLAEVEQLLSALAEGLALFEEMA
ncbi:aminotransferase class V-fold PLP-dependent enzyme [Gallaecimonas sp. GXIMD1310]|uniref:aminotransferase class V-fold PLP-dependent enzyme n=1 Tax=Gallaecimonas sp. GXIMD1310 TaxID=3131926 RepID=UPI00324FE926